LLEFPKKQWLDEDIMPKLKTHRGAHKRFKKTATGKVKRRKAFLRHILTSKDKKRKGHLGQTVLVSDADTPKVKRMIPYD
jgi:large subunit ribosomal protein L35